MNMMDELLPIRINYEKTVILIAIQNSYFSSRISVTLFLSLVRIDYFSNYKNIIFNFRSNQESFFLFFS